MLTWQTGGVHVGPLAQSKMAPVPYSHINQKYKTNYIMPVADYSTLLSVAYGASGKEACLDGQIIKARQLEEIASK
jgi:heterodisulfide reductase subunit B